MKFRVGPKPTFFLSEDPLLSLSPKESPKETPKKIVENMISEWVAPLGYDVVLLEIAPGGQRKIQLFIDRRLEDAAKGAVGIEDCVAVTRSIDERLDALPEIERIFGGHSYDLEVSSPGVDRPLRTEQDFERFAGKLARIHVFRPLSVEEIGNAEYLAKNPKQKNFVGTLVGLQDHKLLLALLPEKKSTKKNKNSDLNDNDQPKLTIPLELVAKANLEPVFDFSEERKTKP